MATFRLFFEALGLPSHSYASVDVALVRKMYQQTLIECRSDDFGELGQVVTATIHSEMERFEQWRVAIAAVRSTSIYAPGRVIWRPPRVAGAGSEDSAQGARDLAGRSSPCAQQPHCWRWERKRRRLDSKRSQEYLFLYAASAGCVRCMHYYARDPDLDVRCESSGMNARGWAAQADQLTSEMEEFLQHLKL